MFQDEEGLGACDNSESSLLAEQKFLINAKLSKSALITILVCVAISAFFLRAGFLSFFYLAPLGYAIMVSANAFNTFFIAAITNIIFILASRMFSQHNTGSLWIDIFYLTTMFFIFSWLIGSRNIRNTYRLIAGAVIGAAAFLLVINSPGSQFFTVFARLSQEITEVIIASAGMDAARYSALTPENMVALFKGFLLRGGALSSMLFLLFINRHIAISIFGIIKKQKYDKGLTAFYAPKNTIWLLSCALAFLILTNILRIEILEIIAWNVVVVCGIIFLAQGTAILMYFLANKTSGFKLAVNVLIIAVLFSPLSTVAVASILFLGIAENFWRFRAPV
ncbi:MAG: YybS family protein [Treponema sp.]|nr:YybS family protein [Treponema sp.]